MGLGLSPAMVARIIAAGTLEVVGEDVASDGPSAGPALSSAASDDRREGAPELAGGRFTTAIAEVARASLAPLVAELAASRRTHERQTDALRALERENGELRAENAVLKATQAALDASAATEGHNPCMFGCHAHRGAFRDSTAGSASSRRCW